MPNKRYIEVNALEHDGWFLSRHAKNKNGIACIESKPLRCVPSVDLPEPQLAELSAPVAEISPFADRIKDDEGKWICGHCGKRIQTVKAPFCAWCGAQFDAKEAEENG